MKTQYLKQADGSIIKFDAQFIINDDGKEIQIVGVEGTEVGEGAYKAQEAKREKEKLAAQEEAANLAKAKAIEREAIDEVIREQFSKEIAERIKVKQAAKAVGLPADEMKAVIKATRKG